MWQADPHPLSAFLGEAQGAGAMPILQPGLGAHVHGAMPHSLSISASQSHSSGMSHGMRPSSSGGGAGGLRHAHSFPEAAATTGSASGPAPLIGYASSRMAPAHSMSLPTNAVGHSGRHGDYMCGPMPGQLLPLDYNHLPLAPLANGGPPHAQPHSARAQAAPPPHYPPATFAHYPPYHDMRMMAHMGMPGPHMGMGIGMPPRPLQAYPGGPMYPPPSGAGGLAMMPHDTGGF